MAPRRMPGPMPWFKHPVRLSESDQARHLAHLLAAAGDPSPDDASRSVVVLLWELAARCEQPGTITTPDAVVESALRKRGVVPMLIECGLAVRDDAGLHVVMFADLNDAQARDFAADRERRRDARAQRKVSSRVLRPSSDRPPTVAGPSPDGPPPDADADADADADQMKNSSRAPSTPSTPAAPSALPVPCVAIPPLTSDVLGARAERDAPREMNLFDDDTMTGPPVTQDAPATVEATTTPPVAAKRAKPPRKRADGTAPDTRIPEVIRGWEAAYLDRCRIPAPKLSPKAAAQEFGAIGTLIRRIDPSMTGADIVGLLDHALMLAQGSDYEAGKWRGMPLRALLSDGNVAKLRLSKATHERTVARSWSAEGVG